MNESGRPSYQHSPYLMSSLEHLKNITINFWSLTFDCIYLHVMAHQDDVIGYNKLSRSAQMKYLCDGDAKKVIWGLELEYLPLQDMFPLEPISASLGKLKLTSETEKYLPFWAQRQIVKNYT